MNCRGKPNQSGEAYTVDEDPTIACRVPNEEPCSVQEVASLRADHEWLADRLIYQDFLCGISVRSVEPTGNGSVIIPNAIYRISIVPPRKRSHNFQLRLLCGRIHDFLRLCQVGRQRLLAEDV